MNSKKNTIMTIVFVIVFAVAIFGAYFFVKNLSDKRSKEKAEKEAQPTEIQLILAIDINNNYPETARTLLKLYGRIVTAIYNDNPTDAELSGLQMQLRKLFDEELLEQNSIPAQLSSLKLDIMDYQDKGRKIESFQADSANNAEYSTVDEKKYCRMFTSVTLVEKSYVGKVYEEFILRQDQDGKWKILGWRRVDENGLPMD